MRTSLRLAAAAAGVLASLAICGGALAAGSPVLVCNSPAPYVGGTYASVIVPPNGNCQISDATILGDVTVADGATLDLASSTSARVGGDVRGGAGATVEEDGGWTIGGTVTTVGSTWAIFGGGTTHNLVFQNTDNVYVYSTDVEGSIAANRTQSYGEIASNTPVAGDVVVNATARGAGGFYVLDQVIGGSVYLTANQSPTYVELNTIRHNLVCYGNNPPPTDEGQGNEVDGRELGQCAAFANSPQDGAGG